MKARYTGLASHTGKTDHTGVASVPTFRNFITPQLKRNSFKFKYDSSYVIQMYSLENTSLLN